MFQVFHNVRSNLQSAISPLFAVTLLEKRLFSTDRNQHKASCTPAPILTSNQTMEISFHGKTALVTGASQGIGRDICIRLASSGAKVIAVARNVKLLEELSQASPSIVPISLDLSDWDATKATLAQIGPVDLLVNNAGVAVLKPLSDYCESDFDRVFDVNIKALFHVTQIIAKNLLDRKAPGSIVNVSSQASMAGLLNHTVYCSSKAAVDGFTRAAALELGPSNIRVNAVNPTVIMTDMGRLGWSDPKVASPMLEKIPLRRFGEVREVVDAVLYLLSDKSSMITGTCLPIDGGFLAC